jgi:preprotein translocase subunit SecB
MSAVATIWSNSTVAAACCRCCPRHPPDARDTRLRDNPPSGPSRQRGAGPSLPPSETIMADQDPTPIFQIQRMYLKDLSLEQPNSPQILLEQQQPQVEINLAMGAEPVGEGVFEVTVTATVTTKVKDKTLFLVEAKQAGIFEIRHVPEDQMQGIISIVCPQMIYPYLRAIVSDVCTRAGFPPILLTEVNFQAMFEAQQAQAAAQNGNGASSIITSAN